MKRDAILALSSRGLRTFPLGYLSVVVPIYLASTRSAVLLGSFYSVSILSSFGLLAFMSVAGHRLRMRFVLAVQVLMLGVTLMVMSATAAPAFLLLAAAVSLTNWAPGGGSGTAVGPYITSFNLVLTEKTDSRSRTLVFAVSSVVGTVAFAVGAYFLSVSRLVSVRLDLPGAGGFILSLASPRSLFAFAAAAEVIAVLLILQISGRTLETPSPGPAIGGSSYMSVIRSVKSFITAESLNGLGQGMFQRFVPLWFYLRFSISVEEVGQIIAVAGGITAFLIILAPRVERRLGSANSIFLGRGLNALLTAATALAPTLPVALAIYYCSLVTSRIAAPIQQSFVFSTVEKRDWARASGSIAMSYAIGNAVGPVIGAFLILDVNLALPLLLGAPFLLGSAYIYRRSFPAGGARQVQEDMGQAATSPLRPEPRASPPA